VELEAFAGLKERARNPAGREAKKSASFRKSGFDEGLEIFGYGSEGGDCVHSRKVFRGSAQDFEVFSFGALKKTIRVQQGKTRKGKKETYDRSIEKPENARREMKISFAGFFALLVLANGCQPQGSNPNSIQVYFSPRGGATEAVAGALAHATNNVLVQAYSFTSAPIAKALLEAHRRGVEVKVILDKSQRTEKYSEADFLKNSEVPTMIDAQHSIAHNKIMIVDNCTVLTGSFNFTKAAEESNAENLLVINDPALAKEYVSNWHLHERHSEMFTRETTEEGHSSRGKRE